MGFFDNLTGNKPLRCPRCQRENYPSEIHRGLHYRGRMETARDYVCSNCYNEYNNGPGYPGSFVSLTPTERLIGLYKQTGMSDSWIRNTLLSNGTPLDRIERAFHAFEKGSASCLRR